MAWLYLGILLTVASAHASNGLPCRTATGAVSETFLTLVEQLVAKGLLDADAIARIERSTVPLNPATFCGGMNEIEKHVFGQAFAAHPPASWANVRRYLRDTLLPRLHGVETRRADARDDTARIPAPRVLQILPDVVSAVGNASHREPSVAFTREGRSWALVRSLRGLVLVDLAGGETKTFHPEPEPFAETPIFFEHGGKAYLVTVENHEGEMRLRVYDPSTGWRRDDFPVPGAPPLTMNGLSITVIDGKPYAVQSYSFSHFTTQPKRDPEPGVWLTPLEPDAGAPIRLDTHGRFFGDPAVGKVGERTWVAAASGDGKKVHFTDLAGSVPKAAKVDTFLSFESKPTGIQFFADRGKPRVLVTTKEGLAVFNPETGHGAGTVSIGDMGYSKGVRRIELDGRSYWLTNTYRDVHLVDVETRAVTSIRVTDPETNNSITTRPHLFAYRGKSYLACGTYDGHVVTMSVPGGEVIAKTKISRGEKIMDLLTTGAPGETHAVVVPFGEPARLIDFLSAEK